MIKVIKFGACLFLFNILILKPILNRIGSTLFTSEPTAAAIVCVAIAAVAIILPFVLWEKKS